jgi:hypothetical protein
MEDPTPDYQQLMRTWFEFVSKMTSAVASAAGAPPPAGAARQLRDLYFQNLGRSLEEFMRSPPFLEMMKQSTDSAVALRQQTNELLANTHHAMGGVARQDIDAVLMAVRRCETRVLDRLDELAARLEPLEAAAARQGTSGNGKVSRKASERPQKQGL